MSELKVNTQLVHNAATALKTINNQISDGFQEVQNAVIKLDSAWDGSAAASSIGKFNEIKSKYPQARYNVIENYVDFLLEQVGEGYTQTEETNKSLSESFM